MNDNYIVLKIAAGVVLGLLLWNAFERYQQRKAVEHGLRELQRIAADPDPMGLRAAEAQRQSARNGPVASSLKPIPPGFRCEQRTLLKRVSGGWEQVTASSNEWYCPSGGVDKCYQVSPQSTGCR